MSGGLFVVGITTGQSTHATTLGRPRPLAWIVPKSSGSALVEPGLKRIKLRDIESCFQHLHNRASYSLHNF
jgi:hypothetical protein